MSVGDVGLERSEGFDLVELVLGEHGVPCWVQVHVFQVTIFKVFHGRVHERHEIVFCEFDGVRVDGESCVQGIGAFGDIVVDGDFLNGGDFLDHNLGESFGMTGGIQLVLAFALLL